MTTEDRLTWEKVVNKAFTKLNLLKSWSEVGEAGVGSIDAVEKVWALIVHSKFHSKQLDKDIYTIMEAAAVFADSCVETDADVKRFHDVVARKTTNIAASYMCMGVMLGINMLSEYEEQKEAKADGEKANS